MNLQWSERLQSQQVPSLAWTSVCCGGDNSCCAWGLCSVGLVMGVRVGWDTSKPKVSPSLHIFFITFTFGVDDFLCERKLILLAATNSCTLCFVFCWNPVLVLTYRQYFSSLIENTRLTNIFFINNYVFRNCYFQLSHLKLSPFCHDCWWIAPGSSVTFFFL